MFQFSLCKSIPNTVNDDSESHTIFLCVQGVEMDCYAVPLG